MSDVEINVIAESASVARLHAGRIARTVGASGYDVEVGVPQARGRRGRAWVCQVLGVKQPNAALVWLENEGKVAGS